MQLISFPFALRGGAVATVTQDADSGDVDAVARMALTRQNEWKLVPSYGVRDAAFDELSIASINAGLATHGPQCVTVTAEVKDRTATSETIALSIKRETV